jgi:monothiol glutaredoxin
MKDEELREQVKEMSEWPTFPQFYANGKLIGGCDIMHELHKEGKLKALLQ